MNTASRICGQWDATAPLISDLVQHAVQDFSPVVIADLYADLGRLDETCVWLERAWEQLALAGMHMGPGGSRNSEQSRASIRG